jgi:threonine synthase
VSAASPPRLSKLVCAGCGASPATDAPYPFQCPNAGVGDVDHVLVRVLDASRLRFPGPGADDGPFARYRGLLHSYHRAVAGGVGDEEFVALVARLDRRVAEVDGHGFLTTPFARNDWLSEQLGFSPSGGVWVKDETGNVAGSHKGRHLMGLLLHLEVAERLGLADPAARPDLAIASCGNAALAAAVVARAGGRRLRVFVPVDADPVVVQRLEQLEAHVVVCSREVGVPGDPCYVRLREAIADGALPFTCQGNENGLVIEGGETIGYEMASELAATGVLLDHLVVQVGGGALASACVQAFDEAVELGALARGPRIHTAQTTSAHPLERAFNRVRALVPDSRSGADIDAALHAAVTHRSAYMWPWESEPKSIAAGILDDETYDWRAVVAGMLASGGRPVVVSEERLAEAWKLGRAAGPPVDPTGSSGLAGLLELLAQGVVDSNQRVAVLFTGLQRTDYPENHGP